MEPKFLKERLFSLLRQSEAANKPQFLGFLSEEEAALAKNQLGSLSGLMFFGGYEDADRVYLGAFPENITPSEKAFPIASITVTYRTQDVLSHRDFLGAVLALGVKREAVGDILIESGRAVIFLSPSVARLISEELRIVGRVGVKISEGFSLPLPDASNRVALSITVSSLRLDCVVAAICSVSRNTANELIAEKRVSVNSLLCEKPTKAVALGDKITVRGTGKFTVSALDGETRKGRIKIKIHKYA